VEVKPLPWNYKFVVDDDDDDDDDYFTSLLFWFGIMKDI